MTVKIREAIETDLCSIVELWKELMDFHKEIEPLFTRGNDVDQVFAEFVRENISKDDACVLVASDGNKIIGYCQNLIEAYPPVLAIKNYGQIMDFAVASKYRRRGIGEKMLTAAKDWYQTKGITRIEVRFTISNEISSKFWPKMGFTPYLKTAYVEI
jgi:ribosomal protein S18 acetylase RimI-like enzyme